MFVCCMFVCLKGMMKCTLETDMMQYEPHVNFRSPFHVMSISGVRFMIYQLKVYISCYVNFKSTFHHVQFRCESHVLSILGAYFMSIFCVHFMSFQFQLYNTWSYPFQMYILYHVNFRCVFHVHFRCSFQVICQF